MSNMSKAAIKKLEQIQQICDIRETRRDEWTREQLESELKMKERQLLETQQAAKIEGILMVEQDRQEQESR